MKRLTLEEIEDFRARWFSALEYRGMQKWHHKSIKQEAEERMAESGMNYSECVQSVIQDAERLNHNLKQLQLHRNSDVKI